MDLLKKVLELINRGKYDECKKICCNFNFPQIRDYFLKHAYETGDFSLYSFVLFMFIETEDYKWIDLALSLVIGPLCFVDGAYSIGLFHARQLVKNDCCVENLLQLLFFYTVPENLITKDEAIEIANRILKLDPSNQEALKIIDQNSCLRKIE